MKCWICKKREANSGEHKFKASIIKKTYGKKYNKNEMLYVHSDSIHELDSFKSNHLKFPKVICKECNDTFTKPHDDSFDLFTNYIDTRGEELSNGIIDFEKVYGANWAQEKRNLYRYFAKHAGCKIVTGNTKYDVNDLSEFIFEKNYSTSLKIHFQYKEGIKIIMNQFDKKFVNLFNGSTVYFGQDENALNYAGWISHNCISTVWVVSPFVDKTKRIDFDKKIEEVEFKSIHDCESFANAQSIRECLDIVECSGLNTLDKKMELYKSVIEK